MIFLGGTCNGSIWREDLIPAFEELGLKYFNPVVEDWNETARLREEEIKARKDTVELFVITPEMTGVFSIAEVVQASNKRPKKTVFWFNQIAFGKSQTNSLKAVGKLVADNGATWVKEYYNIPIACMRAEESKPC